MKVKVLRATAYRNCINMRVEAKVNGQKVIETFRFKPERVESGEYKEAIRKYFEDLGTLSTESIKSIEGLVGQEIEV